jgi:hypothetical protein
LRDALVELSKGKWGFDNEPPAPWLLKANGREWAMATDGHCAVCVDVALVDGCSEASGRVTQPLAKFLETAVEPRLTTTSAALSAFAGVGITHPPCDVCNDAREVECLDCDGVGQEDCECDCGHSHERDCTNCNGEGTLTCNACDDRDRVMAARFAGLFVSRHHLRGALETVAPCSDVSVGVVKLSDRPGNFAFMLAEAADTPRWCALVMSLNEADTSVDFDHIETWAVANDARITTGAEVAEIPKSEVAPPSSGA